MHKYNKIINKLIVFFLLFSTILSLFTTVNAEIDPVKVVSKPTADGTEKLYLIGNTILGIVQVIGIGVALIALLVLGIKYMYHSPEEKAEIKKQLIPFIIGGFLVFGATSLVKIVETFTTEITQ